MLNPISEQRLPVLETNFMQALARLLYARCRIVILDDPFSALDRKTGESVLHNLLGPEGILRNLNTTVFWLENNGEKHFVCMGSWLTSMT